MNQYRFSFLGILLSSLLLISCQDDSGIRSATTVISPASNSSVNGIITFSRNKKGVLIQGQIHRLTPGLHGFHIHQYGDLSKPNGTGAGGHYNPTQAKHGALDAESHHVGDLGNILANSDGTATVNIQLSQFDLDSVIGRAIIVHDQADDLQSQPSGAAGKRVGMGVIGISKPL